MENNNINNNIPFNSDKQNCIRDSACNLDFDSNFDSNSDSDSDEYIDLSSHISSESQDIYQFIVNDDKLELKHIGKFTKAPDIVIKEKFGPDSNMDLFSCVYTYSEITSESELETDSNELFFPLVKLIVQNKSNVIITCISIKLTKPVQIEKIINNNDNKNNNYECDYEWELYWLENKSDSEHIKICKIEKNINPLNIIEKLIGYSVHN